MKRVIAAVIVGAVVGVTGLGIALMRTTETTVVAQDKPEKINNLDEHLQGDANYVKGSLTERLQIVAQLYADKKCDYGQARGIQMRDLLAHARTHEMDPASKLVAFVQWLGKERADYKGDMYKACSRTGAIDALMETYGAQRLYRDEAFLKGNNQAKLARIKELWEARELDQSQAYDLTRMYIYRHLAPAGDDIDKQIELFGQLVKADCLDWAGAAGVHEALLTRALEEKKDLDTVEKKLAWINEHTDSKSGEISWMVVNNRRSALFMHAMDAEMAKLDYEKRAEKIQEWKEKKLLDTSSARDLTAAYCAMK
ncbi:MAG: hypothetical protein KDB82_08685 [Planctomycetes bacterium]|nr:hypothetical protein [Planctomycetota bacterium]